MAKVLLWQQHNKGHFVSFVTYIFGAKFEEQCFSIIDILYFVFYHFSCKPSDAFAFPKNKKDNTILWYCERHVISTLRSAHNGLK